MSKLPFMQLYPDAHRRDTAVLSLASKGAWSDCLCVLWSSPTRGSAAYPITGWARLFGCSETEADAAISEIGQMGIADVSHEGDFIRITCRRMVREQAERDKGRERVARHRDKAKEPEPAPRKREGNADVTPDIEEVRNPPKAPQLPAVTGSAANGGQGALDLGITPPQQPKAKPGRAAAEEGRGEDPRHSAIMQRWGPRFQDTMGFPYVCDGGKDGRALKLFLRSCRDDAEAILAVALQAWRRALDDKFAKACKQAATVAGFCRTYNEIRTELTGAHANASNRQPHRTDQSNPAKRYAAPPRAASVGP